MLAGYCWFLFINFFNQNLKEASDQNGGESFHQEIKLMEINLFIIFGLLIIESQ